MTRRARVVTPVTDFPFTSHVCARTRAYVHKGDTEKPSRVSLASVAALEDAIKAALMGGDTDQAHAIREELIARFFGGAAAVVTVRRIYQIYAGSQEQKANICRGDANGHRAARGDGWPGRSDGEQK